MHNLLLDIGFLHVTLIDVLDILMVAAIIYFLFRWIKGSAAMNIALAIVALLFLRILVDALKMTMMSALLGTVIDVGAIALIVIFQPEIRHFLYNLGRTTFSGDSNSWLGKLFHRGESILAADVADEVVQACFEMAEQKVGALIVFTSTDPLEDIVSTGDKVDATVTKPLIENIFFKNAPLHDGAMIVRGSRIVAARCTLPITDRTDIPARYGMRHKAAIGITEKTDTKVIVVSEQTGDVSFVEDGKLEKMKSKNALKLRLGDDGQKTGSEAGV
ncbi:MAG: diadenylate cyclase CdaA [Bacteroidales bacterium]|nr:diadenylate cyclase CdaA [Bacteroidales bacterium]